MLFHHGNMRVRPVAQQQCAKASVLSSTYNPFPITHCLCPVCHALTHVCSGWLFFNLNVSCSFFNSPFTFLMSSIHLTLRLTPSHTFFAHTCRDHLSARFRVLANECFWRLFPSQSEWKDLGIHSVLPDSLWLQTLSHRCLGWLLQLPWGGPKPPCYFSWPHRLP